MSADGPPGELEEVRRERIGMTGAQFAEYFLKTPKAIPPSTRLLGCRPLEADAERGFCKMAFTNKPEFRNPTGALQGGFIAAMLDDTMAIGGLFKIGGGYFLPTLEMKVNYTRPALTDEVTTEGWLVHGGKTIAFLEGRLLDRHGHLCATSSATALIREFRKTR